MTLRRRPAIGERQDVLINEQLRRCVAFLCVDVHNERTGRDEQEARRHSVFRCRTHRY